MTLTELQTEQARAQAQYYEAKQALESAKRKRLDIARQTIEAEFTTENQRVNRLSNVAAAAKKAVEDELVRLAQDGSRSKWAVGTKLQRGKTTHSWKQPQIEYGILEVMTRETELPANMASYSKPNIGELIVRLCNKDGTPGKRLDVYWRNRGWKPVKG